MRLSRYLCVVIFSVVGVGTGMSGCVAPPAAALTLGFSAAEVGSAYVVRGELRGALDHDFDDVVAAAEATLDELAFTPVRMNDRDGYVYILSEDDRGRRLSVRVTKRTERITTVRIRAGVIADRHVATVVFEAMLQEMGSAEIAPRRSSG